MGDDFTLGGCGVLTVNSDYHPLSVALFDSYQTFGTFLPATVKRAYDNIVRAGITQAFQMFVTVAGSYQSDDLIGKRIVGCNAEGLPLDPTVSAEISLDSTTGTITSSVTEGRHWLIIGYAITGMPDLMDED